MQENIFRGRPTPVTTVVQGEDFNDATTRATFHAAVNELAALDFSIVAEPNWMDAYDEWRADNFLAPPSPPSTATPEYRPSMDSLQTCNGITDKYNIPRTNFKVPQDINQMGKITAQSAALRSCTATMQTIWKVSGWYVTMGSAPAAVASISGRRDAGAIPALARVLLSAVTKNRPESQMWALKALRQLAFADEHHPKIISELRLIDLLRAKRAECAEDPTRAAHCPCR